MPSPSQARLELGFASTERAKIALASPHAFLYK